MNEVLWRGKGHDVGMGVVSRASILIAFIAIAWGIEIVDRFLLGGHLDHFGIRPRSGGGLIGIFLAPFLHVGFGHLAANTIPFFVLGWLVMWRGTAQFVSVSAIIITVGGFGVWILGSSRSCHLGASGLIFGYLGYLILRGYFERSIQSIALAIVGGFFYGGMIWGILPGQRGVSWLGHLTGLLAGALAARLMAK